MGLERWIRDAMWSYNGNLEPLYELEDRGDEIVITLDLPGVEKEGEIKLKARDLMRQTALSASEMQKSAEQDMPFMYR